jgi:hypothetical protein
MVLETSILLKRHGQRYGRIYNQAFTGFPKNVELNNGLPAAQPDIVEGLEITDFDQFPVRRELGEAAVPAAERDPLTLPHLAGEWKGPGEDIIIAEIQAVYDRACMVYGRNQARSFLNRPDPVGHTYVRTFTTDSTTLNTYTHYSSESEGQIKYHQYTTSSSLLISYYEEFKKRRRRLRNLQDDAKETSEKWRNELKEKWLAVNLSPVIPSRPVETAHSECDDEDDPMSQLLAEHMASLSKNNQYDPSVRIPA